MSTKLDIAREMINAIDEEMIALFKERMMAARLVAEHKKEHQLPILDLEREKALIAKNIAKLADETLEEFYLIFLEGMLTASKAYQEDLNK